MADIQASGGDGPRNIIEDAPPRLIAQNVGEATIYFRVTGASLHVSNESEVRAVAAIDSNVFDDAARIASEGMKIIGGKVREIATTLQPSDLEIEISFGFEVKGKATIVPVLLTGEATSNVGLKVTASWKNADNATAMNKL